MESTRRSADLSGKATGAVAARETTVLETIANRIRNASDRLGNNTVMLHDHADRVGGSNPTGEERAEGIDARAGQIGAIIDALDALDGAVMAIETAARRNTTLA